MNEKEQESTLDDLLDAARAADLPCLASFLEAPSSDRDRLVSVLSLSPFLRGEVLQRPHWLEQLFTEDAGDRVAAIAGELLQPVEKEASEAETMTGLRRAKREASLLIALRDLFGAAHPRETTNALSEIAEAATRRAIRFCLLDLQRRGALRLLDASDPETGSGLFVIGMGKLGARELNYSSDIDLIVLFEPDVPALVDPSESVETFSRLARRLVRMLGERTRDGYVFRTDLRLRPDPSAMPLAIPVPTALVYYETSGRDWERAAMIKARCVAGDEVAASAFLRDIGPFVWRRYLDFVAINDIQTMKRRIDGHRGFDSIAVAGQNVKLGRGGIREIEFFTQAQQLIAGGRIPELRTSRTDEGLRRLAGGGWIEPSAAEELTNSYWFLRRVEHAIQMVADEQSHTLPEDEDALLRIARLCNFETLDAFSSALLEHERQAAERFSNLFSNRGKGAEKDADCRLALGRNGDPTAVGWLAEAGFKRPDDIARIVYKWGEGRYRATRSDAAREQMTRILPDLLRAFADGSEPDAALASFDRFLEGLPSGLQFFSLIARNPKLLDLLTLVITSAPALAETIARRPHVFDALLDPTFFRDMPSTETLRDRLRSFLNEAPSYEERLARLRIFASEQRFLGGVRLLSGAIEGEEAGRAFTDLADVVLETTLMEVEREFVAAHGHVADGTMVVLGLGRLGSREMTATSDVDLMLLYDHDAEAETSDGARPLPVSTYYMRLTQRLISALNSPMGEGVLYDVDFRLRPSGNKGPLATHIDAFRKYQQEAWTWERMALTRSRAVAGDDALGARVAGVIRDAIEAHAPDEMLTTDVADMRRRLEAQKPAQGRLDLKRIVGGLTDLEFVAQWAILSGHVALDLIGCPTASILRAAKAALGAETSGLAALETAMTQYTRVLQLTRLGPSNARSVSHLPPRLADRLAQALDLADRDRIEAEIDETAAGVRTVFADLIFAKAATP